MLRFVFPVILSCIVFLTANAQRRSGSSAPQIKIEWRIIENYHQGKPGFQSEFIFTNTGKSDLPAKGWSLFFNIARSIRPESVGGGMRITNINGDLFQLTPTEKFTGLKRGQTVHIPFVGSDWVVNYTDAPLGLFWVLDKQPDKGLKVEDYHIIPSTETKQIQRAPGDHYGFTTAADIYRQNSGIKDLPAEQLIKILPTPAYYRETGKYIYLSNIRQIHTHPDFINEANWLAGELETIMGRKIPVADGMGDSSEGIRFLKVSMSAEAYEIKMDESRITIRAGDAAGAFYAIQSLRSLLPAEAFSNKMPRLMIPAVDVKDAPRFGFRAFMLDVGRNFHSRQQVLRVLDLMALYKLNVFHFHFSEDEGWRLEMPSLPELTSIGSRRGFPVDESKQLMPSFGSGPDTNSSGTGYYSKDEFIEILKYAQARHIKVIPEIESPGHARAAVVSMKARYERLMNEGKQQQAEEYMLHDPNDQSAYRSVQGWRDNAMNVAQPGVYRFMARVFDDLIAMYKEAGVPLEMIHVGGDELPAGVWEKSPMAQELIAKESDLNETSDLWYYYFEKLNGLLKERGLSLYGWEEAGMRKTKLDGKPHYLANPDFAKGNFQLDVWNNMLGWGAEDLAYKLANAGYEIILSPVSNMYFDMSYYKNFDEPGYYWGGYIDLDKPWQFIPHDYYRNARKDKFNTDLPASFFEHKERLTDYGKKHIKGVQGLLWSETLVNPEMMEYMLLPKLLGMAERAWAPDPVWASEAEPMAGTAYRDSWNEFVNRIGKRELPKLDHLSGGFAYRIPTPGVIAENGTVKANIQLPGLHLRYTVNGGEPDKKSAIYREPITEKGTIRIKAFAGNGRSGRMVTVNNP